MPCDLCGDLSASARVGFCRPSNDDAPTEHADQVRDLGPVELDLNVAGTASVSRLAA